MGSRGEYAIVLDVRLDSSSPGLCAEIASVSKDRMRLGWVAEGAVSGSSVHVWIQPIDGLASERKICSGRWGGDDASSVAGTVEADGGTPSLLAELIRRIDSSPRPPPGATAEFSRAWNGFDAADAGFEPERRQRLLDFFAHLLGGDSEDQRLASNLLGDGCARGIEVARLLRTVLLYISQGVVLPPRKVLEAATADLVDAKGLEYLERRRHVAAAGSALLSRFIKQDVVKLWLDGGDDDVEPDRLIEDLVEGQDGSVETFLTVLRAAATLNGDTEGPFLGPTRHSPVWCTPTADVDGRSESGVSRSQILNALGLDGDREHLQFLYPVSLVGSLFRPTAVDAPAEPRFVPAEARTDCTDWGTTVGSSVCLGLREALHMPLTALDAVSSMVGKQRLPVG